MSAPDAEPEAIADAHARLDLRELAARDGIDAAPAFFDVLEKSDSASMRAEAATLLSVVGHPDAFEEIYHEIVRVIDARGPELRRLLAASAYVVQFSSGEAVPRWALALGAEASDLAREENDAREPALALLVALQERTGESYSSVGLLALRSGIRGPGTRSAFLLLSDDDIIARREELIEVCRDLLGTSSRMEALRFAARARRFVDLSPIRSSVEKIAASEAYNPQDRKLAALTLAAFEGVHPAEMYARFGLLEEK